jgi:hypothetical protein
MASNNSEPLIKYGDPVQVILILFIQKNKQILLRKIKIN